MCWVAWPSGSRSRSTRSWTRWAADDDFWIRRSALLALLVPLRRGETASFERFARYADGMLSEREFFIRKAIGWVLRETGKRQPDLVAAWLAPRAPSASGVTMREAVRYLAPGQRDALMAAYRSPPEDRVNGELRTFQLTVAASSDRASAASSGESPDGSSSAASTSQRSRISCRVVGAVRCSSRGRSARSAACSSQCIEFIDQAATPRRRPAAQTSSSASGGRTAATCSR